MIPIQAPAVAGGTLWLTAVVVTGLPRGRTPSWVSILFSVFAGIGYAIALTGITSAPVDVALIGVASVLYLGSPIVITAYLLQHYDNEDASQTDPRTIN